MKDKKKQPERQEKLVVIDITLTRGLLILLALVVIVAAACLGTLAWGQKKAAASAPAAPAVFTGMRKYYLTQTEVDGDETLTACASGYHMASLWEILDPSNLEYNTDLGFTRDDSGAGPPSEGWGWIRTGYNSYSTGDSHIGRNNCANWTTDDEAIRGTYLSLPYNWTSTTEHRMHVWWISKVPTSAAVSAAPLRTVMVTSPLLWWLKRSGILSKAAPMCW